MVVADSIAATMGATGAGEASGSVSRPSAMGATIRALRRRAGLSQMALGARIAMHHNYVGTIERGGIPNPGLETVDRIARGLDVSIAVLAGRFAHPASAASPRGSAEGTKRDALAGACELGDAIRAVRHDLALTQTELAQAAQLNRSHLASIEAGMKPNPGIGTILNIACGLDPTSGEPYLLVPLAQTFTGELTVADLRTTVAAARPSGPNGARPVPRSGATP